MPKESKRFINPLLRPTVEVEPKREEAPTPQPERPASPEKTHTSTDTYAATSQEALVAAQIPELPSPVPPTTEPHASAKRRVVHPSTDTSTFQEETRMQEMPRMREPLPAEREILAEVSEGENMALYTSSAAPRYRNDQVATSGRGAMIDYPTPSQVTPPLTTYVSPSAPQVDVWTPAPLPDTSSLPPTSTYTPTEPDTPSTYGGRDEVVEQEHYSAPPPSRRRRGAQAFEKTHERITLWIDKRLKQAFEELAYEQEISKTALLNEAMADLLNKYASR